jgi:hypothetical protein
MSAMDLRRNIFHDVPVKLLPEDLRTGLDPDAIVMVTIETEGEFPIGSIGIEAVFICRDRRMVKVDERTFTVQ